MEHLRSVMRGGILAVRRVARESRLVRVAGEFESHGLSVDVRHHDVAELVDHVRASRASASFVANPTDASLYRIAVTENAQAFSDMRIAADVAEGVRLYRRWDSMLDACPACFERDGETVPLGQSFSGDEPGSVHPHCRCTWELVSERELTLAA